MPGLLLGISTSDSHGNNFHVKKYLSEVKIFTAVFSLVLGGFCFVCLTCNMIFVAFLVASFMKGMIPSKTTTNALKLVTCAWCYGTFHRECSSFDFETKKMKQMGGHSYSVALPKVIIAYTKIVRCGFVGAAMWAAPTNYKPFALAPTLYN